jgi:hypothetical protein
MGASTNPGTTNRSAASMVRFMGPTSPAVFSKRVTAARGTGNEDGSIHLTYVSRLHEDGPVFVETSSVTRKARNIAGRPSATFLVQAQASTGRTLNQPSLRQVPGPWRL